MTTYLATVAPTPDDPITNPYCSSRCREIAGMHWRRLSFELRVDDSYEFDETCTNCGALIPAARLVPDNLCAACEDGDTNHDDCANDLEFHTIDGRPYLGGF